MKYLSTLLLFLFILSVTALKAQQEPMYSQYFFNNSVLNPAQAGASGYSQAGVLIRDQWVGIDGAPRTLTAFANMRLPWNLGVAAGLYQDRLGPEVNTQMQLDVAYHARLSDAWHLAAGVRFSTVYTRVGLTEVPNVDPRNPLFTFDVNSGLKVNTGVGLLAYTENTWIGVSLPKAFKTTIKVTQPGVAEFQKEDVRTFFAYGGTNITLSQNFMLTPSALIRVSTIPAQLDVNAVVGYRKIVDFGLILRSNLTNTDDWFNTTGFMVGISYWKNWYLGYLYEIPLTQLQNATMQTHEISLRFFWGLKGKDIKSPRYFL